MKAFAFIVAVLAVAALGAWYFFIYTPSFNGTDEKVSTFTFDDAGLKFEYPDSYTFESYPLEDETASWNSLMLVRTKDKESAEANGASEGPVAITIGIFQNDSGQSLEDWVHTNPHSNFSLSKDQSLTTVTVGGVPGFAFTHTGLFESDTVAVAHNGVIYLFDVSWMDANDSIRADFQNLLKTVQFK